MATLQTEIEGLLAEREPEVEVLLAEVVGGGALRVFIDHPEGVTLALCERVTGALPELRERYALEVSSPGIERPLTKPEHFRRFVGRRARVRAEAGGHSPATEAERHSPAARIPRSAGIPVSARGDQPAPAGRAPDARQASHMTRRSYTGELVGASESEITLAADGALVTIPYAQIRRSNLVEE
jgi:ribosome maturation factor RimP